MASKGAIGATRDLAVRRMQAAMARISAGTGIEPAAFPFFRQSDYQAAATLDVLAGYFERVADFFAPASSGALESTLPDYANMTRADVLKRAEAAGMPVTRNTSKGEAVDWLMAAAGISEDEQQSLDTDAAAEG